MLAIYAREAVGSYHLHVEVRPSPVSSLLCATTTPDACSSVAAGTGGVIGPQYASSKSALHGLIHWLSQRYCKEGIVSATSLDVTTDSLIASNSPQLTNGVAPALIEGAFRAQR